MPKKIECRCISMVNEQLSKHNTQLDTKIIGILTGKPREVPVVATVKLNTRKHDPAKTVVPTYCPFCGKKL